MNLRQTSAPASYPVTSAEAKAHCRIDGDDDNDGLTRLIATATADAERESGRALVTQTWVMRLNEFPDVIILPYPPLQSVTSITYVDTNGTTQTLAAAAYTIDIYSEPGTIREAYGYTWPATREIVNAITITYVCGYGAASAVPPEMRQTILEKVLFKYLNRGDVASQGEPVTASQFHHGWQF